MNQKRLPLSGIKVLDLSRFLAGPYCSMILGDHGAEVLKVEPPGGGDPTRLQGPPFLDGEGLTYLATNRNKSSVVLDFKKAEDLELLRRLAGDADVLVENFRPGILERFALDYESLRQLNPRLIFGSISGFGSTGPMADQGAFDLTIQALGGYMSITGEPGRPPIKLGTSAMDMLAGMNLFSAIMVALFERSRTGKGQHVETSLLESQVALLSNAAFEHLLGVGTPQKMGSEHPQLVPYKAFPTTDGWIVIGAGVQNLFEKLVQALGQTDLLTDERCASLAARLRNRPFVNEAIERLTSGWRTSDLVAKLTAAGVPSAPVLSIAEVFQSEQVRERKMVVQLNHERPERQLTLGSPIKYSDYDLTEAWQPAPRLGEGGREMVDRWLNEKAP